MNTPSNPDVSSSRQYPDRFSRWLHRRLEKLLVPTSPEKLAAFEAHVANFEESEFDDDEDGIVFTVTCLGPDGSVRSEVWKPADYRPGRNEPCWCGSDEKYKRCHWVGDQQA